MINPKQARISSLLQPILQQRFYLISYVMLQLAIVLMILFFAQGRPIWYNIVSRYGSHSNYALVPVYQKQSTSRIRQHFDIVRQSSRQTNNPSAVLEQALNNPKIQQLGLSASDIEFIYGISERLLDDIYSQGYLDEALPNEAQRSGFVVVREQGQHDKLIEARTLITKENLHAYIQSSLAHYDAPTQLLSEALVELFLQENLSYISLERHSLHDVSRVLLFQERLGIVLYVMVVAFVSALVILRVYREQIAKLYRYQPFAKRYHVLLVLEFIALSLSFVMLAWAHQYVQVPRMLLLPGSLFSFMVTFLFGYRQGMLFALYYTLIFILAAGFDMFASLYIIASVPASVYLASLCKTRSQLFFASFWQALVNAITIIVLSLANTSEQLNWTTLSTAIFSGLAVSPLALGLSPIVERILNLPSSYRLLDLCDLNAPTLRRLQNLAPGTYTHSLNVAILAENACQRVKANGLLARVGAYYHDIGKMENPEYFVENQNSGNNKHNQMRANLSAAVIRAHVRIGLEMGKVIRLPQEILDIICQHHGKSLVSFFYHRAQDEPRVHEYEVNEADFRYAGPRPRTKESAIVMLADSVEAASHTLKKPNQASIAKLVEDIIMHKFETDELEESPLTLKDLQQIKESLIHSLVGQYHHRIEYPENKKS